MEKLKSGIVLTEGENVVVELEAELWAASSNPLAKLVGQVVKFINLILGNKRKGYVVITNKRVVEVIQFTALWVLNAGKNVKYVLPSSVKEVGYTKARSSAASARHTVSTMTPSRSARPSFFPSAKSPRRRKLWTHSIGRYQPRSNRLLCLNPEYQRFRGFFF